MCPSELKPRSLAKFPLLAVFLATCMAAVVVYIPRKPPGISMRSPRVEADLFKHPIYSQYEFNQNDTVIHIGYQPFYLPAGIILEAVKRDQILMKAISALGKEIKYYSFLKGADVNFFLRHKMLEGGIGGDMPALAASSTLDLFVPVTLQKGNASIVSTRPMLSNDMKGKRIAYPEGSISHYFLLDLLKSSGISKDQATLIPMEISAMPAALHKNEIDVFSAWEPIVTSSIKQRPEFFIVYKNITTGYLYFLRDFFQKNREALFHILAAAVRAVRILKSDRSFLKSACQWNIEEMENLSGEKSILTAEEIAGLAQDDILGYFSLHDALVIREEDLQTNGRLYNEYQFLRDLREIPDSGSWEEARKSFDHEMITEILRYPKKYKLNEFDYGAAFVR